MKSKPIPYEEATVMLDADHNAVKQLFIDYAGLADDRAPAAQRADVAGRITRALTIHAQLEEEIFYPAYAKATGDMTLSEQALEEHARIKALVADVEASVASGEPADDLVRTLGQVVDLHVLHEREEMFIEARGSQMDLKGLVAPLTVRRKQLGSEQPPIAPPASPTATVSTDKAGNRT